MKYIYVWCLYTTHQHIDEGFNCLSSSSSLLYFFLVSSNIRRKLCRIDFPFSDIIHSLCVCVRCQFHYIQRNRPIQPIQKGYNILLNKIVDPMRQNAREMNESSLVRQVIIRKLNSSHSIYACIGGIDTDYGNKKSTFFIDIYGWISIGSSEEKKAINHTQHTKKRRLFSVYIYFMTELSLSFNFFYDQIWF